MGIFECSISLINWKTIVTIITANWVPSLINFTLDHYNLWLLQCVYHGLLKDIYQPCVYWTHAELRERWYNLQQNLYTVNYKLKSCKCVLNLVYHVLNSHFIIIWCYGKCDLCSCKHENSQSKNKLIIISCHLSKYDYWANCK